MKVKRWKGEERRAKSKARIGREVQGENEVRTEGVRAAFGSFMGLVSFLDLLRRCFFLWSTTLRAGDEIVFFSRGLALLVLLKKKVNPLRTRGILSQFTKTVCSTFELQKTSFFFCYAIFFFSLINEPSRGFFLFSS